jgi:RNA polymerase sigma-70 factor (ECF subfamily)
MERTDGQDLAPDDDFDGAFRDLFVRAYRVARRILGDPSAAEDVAAEALSRSYAHWKRISRLPYRDAWVLRVATNIALDAARRRPLPLPPEASETHDDQTATRLALVAALQALPPRQREVIALRHLADLSESEVAAHLGLSLGTVKTHLRRAKERLRGQLTLDMIPGEV